MRLGIYGGSFDPVHYGHLLLAECCREQLALDEVWFLPAAVPPHKTRQARAADKHRAEMLQLAIGGHDAFRLATLELERGGVNYTFETLEQIQRDRPDDRLFFLMGADSLDDFPRWREPARICQAATISVVARPGAPAPDFDALLGVASGEQIAAMRAAVVTMPLIELSSSDLRRRVAAGQSVRYRTPAAVRKYIESHGLYR
ncbi:MAG: nicotinate-nucleotide adenylyltransferase [Planctomycetales bacterium]|nr:nicotinate-nucleotide adenylyltransferase [Planctomycetales bacterium]